jgi:hypothetical protein
MDPPQLWIRLFERAAAAAGPTDDDSPGAELHAAELNRDLAAAIPEVRPL